MKWSPEMSDKPTDPIDEAEAIVIGKALRAISGALNKLAGLLTVCQLSPSVKPDDMSAALGEIHELTDQVVEVASLLELEDF
jgi:hypothetical protein